MYMRDCVCLCALFALFSWICIIILFPGGGLVFFFIFKLPEYKKRVKTAVLTLFYVFVRKTSGLIGKQGILLHRLVHALAHGCYHFLILGIVEHLFYQFGYQHHHVFFRTTGGDGGRS